MTTNIDLSGKIKAVRLKLSSTSAFTVITGDANAVYTLKGIHYSCRAGGSTFSVYWTKDAVDYYLLEDKAISANTGETILTDTPLQIRNGTVLKVKAGTADKIDVTAFLIESVPTMTTDQHNLGPRSGRG